MSDEFNAPELMGFPKYLQQKGTGWHCQAKMNTFEWTITGHKIGKILEL